VQKRIDTAFDQRHIWHPYTSTTTPLPCYPVTKADGIHLYLEDGTTLIDGMSSWWAAIHGYNHPKLNEAIFDQTSKMSHVMFGGLTHQPAIDLCEKLLRLTPPSLQKIFLADSGSVAVEVALKMAMQYWHSKNTPRSRFLTVKHGYHGDTFAAMSVTDPENSMHSLYKGFLPHHYFAEACSIGFHEEWHDSAFDDFQQQFTQHQSELAAVIIEPIVQGAGGMRIYHPMFLTKIRQLCDQSGVLLIADEIATGFGRTGKLFACEHADITPDILCLGKALTGGYMTLSAVLTTNHIADTVCSGDAKCFMHGPTFMGNPLACAVASASLSLIENNQWQTQVQNIEQQFSMQLPLLLAHQKVKTVRWLGAIGVVELHDPIDIATIQEKFVKQGVWIRPFGKLIYLMPPYIIKPAELNTLIKAIGNVL
jgi:adenosylmethionine-8-amino-7-oxononanoate aminotransferase